MNGTLSWQNATIPDLFLKLQSIPFNQESFRVLVFHAGSCLNWVIVVMVILYRLSFPHEIAWAAISFLQCGIVLQFVLELVIMIDSDHLACQTAVLLAPVCYSLVLLILLLTVLSNYSDMVCDKTNKVSLWDVVLLLAINCAMIYMINICPIWVSYQAISSCTVDSTHISWIFQWGMFLAIVFIILFSRIVMASKTTFLKLQMGQMCKPKLPVNYNIRPGMILFQILLS